MPKKEQQDKEKNKPNSCAATPSDRSLADRAADAIVGFGDAFLIPIIVREIFEIDGGINYDSPEYSIGEIVGTVWGLVPFALESAAAAGATKAGHALNHNRYFRIGPGRWGKDMVPRASSKYLPGDGHVNLSSRIGPIPPAGELLDAKDCP